MANSIFPIHSNIPAADLLLNNGILLSQRPCDTYVSATIYTYDMSRYLAAWHTNNKGEFGSDYLANLWDYLTFMKSITSLSRAKELIRLTLMMN